MKHKTGMLTSVFITAILLSGCATTDVVGESAKSSFREVIEASGSSVTEDEENGGWSLTAPDSSARFIWSEDTSKTPTHDVMLVLDAAPFIAAGLDVNALEDGIYINDTLMLGVDLGNEAASYDGTITPEAAFDQIVLSYRDSIGYHEVLDHYGVDAGNGNKFEWAKDMSKNDKDIVFVVDPQMLIDAGVTPESVEGWVYTSVEIKDETGKPVEVMKFLKPFDLK